MNTTRVLRKQTTIWSPKPDHEAQRKNFANGKVPSKNQQFWRSWKSLSQVFPDFPLEETRHASPKPRQRTIRKISLLIEYGRARFVTHIVTHHTWPSHKRSNPHPQPPLFSKTIFLTSTFFQIWRHSFWRFFSVGDSDCRRFDRTFRETRLTSRPEIRSDSATDDPLTALTTPMI